jgi:hypothetical protein
MTNALLLPTACLGVFWPWPALALAAAIVILLPRLTSGMRIPGLSGSR